MGASSPSHTSSLPRWRVWLLGARPATLFASVTPVLVGTAVGVRQSHSLRVLPFLAALTAAVLIQIGTNYANDLFDYLKGADTPARAGPTRITARGLVTPAETRRAVIISFGLAALLGLYLIAVGGWPILLIGMLSIASGILYTAGPWPLGYIGLGDLFVFLFFGLAAVMGSAELQSGAFSWLAFWAAIPIGLLVTNILIINNVRDIPTDRSAGKRTLAVRIGDRASRWQYVLFLLIAYLVPLGLWLSSAVDSWILVSWLSLPAGIWLARRVLSGVTGPALNPLLKRTGQFVLLYGILFALGVLW